MKRQLILAGMLIAFPCRAVYASPEDDAAKASGGFYSLREDGSPVLVEPFKLVFPTFIPAPTATATPSPEPTPSPTATATPSPKPTRRPAVCKNIKIEWVSIPGGTFIMGSNKIPSESVHEVTLERFDMAKTLVTFGQYNQCVKVGVCKPPHILDGTCMADYPHRGNLPDSYQGDDRPVVCVDWHQAVEFAKCVGARLPTEAEWEYAARAGAPASYFDDAHDLDVAWHNGRRHLRDKIEEINNSNAWGLHDLLDNVWEWTQDWYGGYPKGAVTNPKGPEKGSKRVMRGGSWVHDATHALFSDRSADDPSRIDARNGFRVAR